MVKLTEIRSVLEKEDLDTIYLRHFQWIKTLIPFWKEAVVRIAELKNFPVEKRDKHLKSIEMSVEPMPAWRLKKVKYVDARRKEIDSAISFIRPSSFTPTILKYAFAPFCRNMIGILRPFLYVSNSYYSDEQAPTVIAQSIYEIAILHASFPFDTSDFVYFLPAEKFIHTDNPADLDNWHLMMDTAGRALQITPLIEEVYKQAAKIWESYDRPFQWQYNQDIWYLEQENLSQQWHDLTVKAFHNR